MDRLPDFQFLQLNSDLPLLIILRPFLTTSLPPRAHQWRGAASRTPINTTDMYRATTRCGTRLAFACCLRHLITSRKHALPLPRTRATGRTLSLKARRHCRTNSMVIRGPLTALCPSLVPLY